MNAVAALASCVIRAGMDRAILRKADAFDRLLSSLKDAYTRAWSDQSRKAIARALDELRAMTPAQVAKFGAVQSRAVLAALETEVGGAAMQAALRGPVLSLSGLLYKLGGKLALEGTGVDVAFGRADMDALRIVQGSNNFWIGEHWSGYTREKFEDALSLYFDQGMTRAQLAERMATDFAQFGERGAHYWDLLADHTATKTREIGRVDGYGRAGIKRVEVRAHIDDNTTAICRAMHGRIIEVSDMRNQRDRYLEATARHDPEAAKRAWPMMSDRDAERLASGGRVANVAGPPYHMRCRTITVAFFG